MLSANHHFPAAPHSQFRPWILLSAAAWLLLILAL